MADFDRLIDMVAGQAEDALERVAKGANYQDPRSVEHVKNLLKIIHYTDEMTGGYSQTGYDRGDWRVEGTIGRSGYDGGTSYGRRGRMGHYSRRSDGMTMQDHLDAMASSAATQQERDMVERFRKEMQR